jgi:predicted outer membrane lipoprotein
MLRGLVLACALAGVSAEAVELTEENWKKEVVDSGKSAFVKFLAPW